MYWILEPWKRGEFSSVCRCFFLVSSQSLWVTGLDQSYSGHFESRGKPIAFPLSSDHSSPSHILNLSFPYTSLSFLFFLYLMRHWSSKPRMTIVPWLLLNGFFSVISQYSCPSSNSWKIRLEMLFCGMPKTVSCLRAGTIFHFFNP